MDSNTLQQMRISPAVFRQHLRIDVNGSLVTLGSVLDDWQEQDFLAMDSAWRKVAGHDVHVANYKGWWERPRGHSKSQDAAVMALWCLAFAMRKVTGVCCAADRDQAALVRQAIERLLANNDWLRAVIEITQWKVTNKMNGSQLDIMASDSASSWGLLVDFAIADEISMWPNDDLWISILSATVKKPSCVLLCALNAGFQGHWAYKVREIVESDPAWYFSALPDSCASWITQEALDEQERILPPSAFNRLFRNMWSTAEGDLLDEAMLDAALAMDVSSDHPKPGFAYGLGCDLGLRKDRSAVVIVGRSPGGMFEVADIHHWTPAPDREVRVGDIQETIIKLHKCFKFSLGLCDPWQGVYLRDILKSRAIPFRLYPLTTPGWDELCRHTINLFAERQVALSHHELLLGELRRTQIIEKRDGKLRFDWPRVGASHGDIAFSFFLALLAAKSARPRQTFQYNRVGQRYRSAISRSPLGSSVSFARPWARKNIEDF